MYSLVGIVKALIDYRKDEVTFLHMCEVSTLTKSRGFRDSWRLYHKELKKNRRVTVRISAGTAKSTPRRGIAEKSLHFICVSLNNKRVHYVMSFFNKKDFSIFRNLHLTSRIETVQSELFLA